MLIQEIKKYPADFLVLAAILTTALFVFLFCPYDRVFREQTVFMAALAYFWWGIFHHWRKDDLVLKVAIEYLSIAVFGTVLVLFVLVRA